jgi:hypothetical protein
LTHGFELLGDIYAQHDGVLVGELGVRRAIGERITIYLLAGNRSKLPDGRGLQPLVSISRCPELLTQAHEPDTEGGVRLATSSDGGLIV